MTRICAQVVHCNWFLKDLDTDKSVQVRKVEHTTSRSRLKWKCLHTVLRTHLVQKKTASVGHLLGHKVKFVKGLFQFRCNCKRSSCVCVCQQICYLTNVCFPSVKGAPSLQSLSLDPHALLKNVKHVCEGSRVHGRITCGASHFLLDHEILLLPDEF